MLLKDRVAIVTGAASGIGLAVAARFAAEGAKVVLADLDPGKAQAAAEGLVGAAAGVRCDVSSPSEVDAACAFAEQTFGGFDVVVNNAGLMTFTPLVELDEATWIRVLGVDLLGAFYFTKALIGRGKGGAIVNIASVHAVETTANVAPYAAAKAALLSLTRSTSIEGKPRGVRANAILPGAIDTPMLWSNPNLKSGIEVLDRADVGKPEHIAAAAAFLASDEAAFITGAALNVDGGRLAKL
ncbi:MAG: dehydrogenase, short-chain alcohol dehydrogenase like protein [Phenylobacterium sp.]|nr:dehydrogenase, short-chain alcohol dehydrogenase like protein [Phenylobacterium sp.]